METLKTFAMYGGVGGISLAVLMFVFRDIIRKNIFPKLTREQAFKIINRIIFVTGAVAVVGLVCWAYVSMALGNTSKTPVRESKEFQAITKFRQANMKYYSNHIDFIVDNYAADQKMMTPDEENRWKAHTDGYELGSYDLARDSFDELNDVFQGQLIEYKVDWQSAMDSLWKLNDETWISRANSNWMRRVQGDKDDEYEDTGIPKSSKREFLKSERYLKSTNEFKEMVNRIAQAATDLMDKSS
ncbi:hypothetical protein [Gimesia fumaroli]|uniref:Uncharacterized protein n=1 Tax=Gimesia fumaroli TaxID=2527976 RepID=A0A518IDK5_9PLAN|nr:hypothetical protein [Gimesia fumaroli]QDV51147.1 hypothetical protein Enr17x_31990 [Gimesia fumaroli]